MGVYLGIDTSCYTTSAALADEKENILCSIKIPLEVAQGKKGLQQSQAVFLHIKNLRRIFEENDFSAYGKIEAVCVSETPRPCEGSYMPVFSVSAAAGAMTAGVTGAQLFYATHQHGHIAAAMIGKTMPKRFLAVHVSGGTTEILSVCAQNGIENIEIVGATLDISAGQVIDRLAQKLGFSFPGGRQVEDCADSATKSILFKTSVSGMNMNFSGLEAQAFRACNEMTPGDICSGVLDAIAKTLDKAIGNAIRKTGIEDVLLFGGVMSNRRIRKYLAENLKKAQFAEIEYAADNAAGLAVLAAVYANKKENVNT